MTDDMNPWAMGQGEAPRCDPRQQEESLRRPSMADLTPGPRSRKFWPGVASGAPSTTPLTPATPAAPACPKCNGDGYFKYAVPFGDPRFGVAYPCECRQGLPSPRQLAAVARMRAALGVYADCTFATFDRRRPLQPLTFLGVKVETDDQRGFLVDAWAAAKEYAADPQGWLYLYGPCGAGKSHLAAAILNACAARGLLGGYQNAGDLLQHVLDGYDDRTYSARLDDVKGLPLLVVDDVKAEYLLTRGRAEILWQLVDHRYRMDLPTVITANVTPQELPDDRITSRILGRIGEPCYMAVSDYRLLPRGSR